MGGGENSDGVGGGGGKVERGVGRACRRPSQLVRVSAVAGD